MARPRKLKAVEETKIVEPVYPVATFNGVDFEIHPFADRDDDFVYGESAKFLVIAIPLASKLINEILTLGADNPAVTDRIVKAKANNEDQAAVIVDLVTIIAKMDIGTLLEEVTEALPKLAAIACHYTDLDVTERDIQRWSKGPMNAQLWKAVIAQFKADNILTQASDLREQLSEFTKAA